MPVKEFDVVQTYQPDCTQTEIASEKVVPKLTDYIVYHFQMSKQVWLSQ